MCVRVCVWKARPQIASRSGVLQPAVSLQLQSNRNATQSAELHSPLSPSALLSVLSNLSLPPIFSFMVRVRSRINSCVNSFLSFLEFQWEGEPDWSNFKQLWIQTSRFSQLKLQLYRTACEISTFPNWHIFSSFFFFFFFFWIVSSTK